MAGDDGARTHPLVFAQAYFVVIASVLGTGILGLPVKLAHSGFMPFLVAYLSCFVMQSFTFLYMTEILQRAHWLVAYNLSRTQEPALIGGGGGGGSGGVSSLSISSSSLEAVVAVGGEAREASSSGRGSSGSSSAGGGVVAGRGSGARLGAVGELGRGGGDKGGAPTEARPDANATGVEGAGSGADGGRPPVWREVAKEELPDLHGIGREFILSAPLRFIFDVAVMLHFLSILISYTLAGSQAYSQMFGISYGVVIPIFWAVYTLVVVFLERFVTPAVSVLTFFKGSLLVVMVFITAFLATKTKEHPSSSWGSLGEPYLLSTVALGGGVNLFPVIYAKVKPNARDLGRMKLATIGALATVALLTLLWCLFLLMIVPQTGPVSLDNANTHGQISTVPLVAIVNGDYPQYAWLATSVNIFIGVSITVSYMTLGMATKHTIDGYIKVWREVKRLTATAAKRRSYGLYIVTFGFILFVSVLDPEGFISILEVVTSMALNLETGVFIVLMVGVSRARRLPAAIPSPISDRVFAFRWVVLAYFLSAVFYDLITTSGELLGLID